VAQIVAFIPDLLFGSNVVGALRAAGHEPRLISSIENLTEQLIGADVLVVDLTADPAERVEQVRPALGAGSEPRTLAFYSHVETEVRALAQDAGFDLVVPRSRMAREGAALIDRLLSGD
jgi:hypothetical protein